MFHFPPDKTALLACILSRMNPVHTHNIVQFKFHFSCNMFSFVFVTLIGLFTSVFATGILYAFHILGMVINNLNRQGRVLLDPTHFAVQTYPLPQRPHLDYNFIQHVQCASRSSRSLLYSYLPSVLSSVHQRSLLIVGRLLVRISTSLPSALRFLMVFLSTSVLAGISYMCYHRVLLDPCLFTIYCYLCIFLATA